MKLKPRIKEDIKKFLIQKEKEEKQKARVVSSQNLAQEEWDEVYIRNERSDNSNCIQDMNLRIGE